MEALKMNIPKGKYQHYKGPYYEVIDLVMHSEDESVLVLYKPLYETTVKQAQNIELWVRPYDMFIEKVKTEAGEVARFQYIG